MNEIVVPDPPYWRPTTLDGIKRWSRMRAGVDPVEVDESGRDWRAGPEEACGFLIKVTNHRYVVAATARNDHEDPEHNYLIHSGDHLDAVRQFGDGLVGVWHSHIDVSAELSTKDMAFAVPGWLYLVYSVRDDAFTLSVPVPGGVIALPVLLVP